MSTNTRATRSRFSSPHPQLGNGTLEPSKTGAASEGSKSFMQKWLEPAVQNRPSYEDHGLMRYGVTEGMVPLGELPKAAVSRRKGNDGVAPVRRIILKQSSANAAAAAASASAAAAAAEEAEGPTAAGKGAGAGSDGGNGVTASSSISAPADSKGAADSFSTAAGNGNTSLLPFSPPPPSPLPRTTKPSPLPQSAAKAAAPSSLSPTLPSPIERSSRRTLPAKGSEDDDGDEYEPKGSMSKATSARTPTPQPRRNLPRASARRASTPHHHLQAATASPSSSAAPAPRSGSSVSASAPASAPAVASEPESTDATSLATNSSTPRPAPPSDSGAPLADLPAAATTALPDKERISKVIDHAVDEAVRHYRYPTAWALRTLYDEKSSDSRFLSLVESVFSQTAEDKELGEFAKLVQAKKREGRQDSQACHHFVPHSAHSRAPQHKPKPAPYRKLVTLNLDLAHLLPLTPEKSETAKSKSSPRTEKNNTNRPPRLHLRLHSQSRPDPQSGADAQPRGQEKKRQEKTRRHSSQAQPPQQSQPLPPPPPTPPPPPPPPQQQQQRQQQHQHQPPQPPTSPTSPSHRQGADTPSKKRPHRSSRRVSALSAAMDASGSGSGTAPSTPSRKRARRGSASSDSSVLSELSSSPSLPSPAPATTRRTIAATVAAGAGGRGGSSSAVAAASASASASSPTDRATNLAAKQEKDDGRPVRRITTRRSLANASSARSSPSPAVAPAPSSSTPPSPSSAHSDAKTTRAVAASKRSKSGSKEPERELEQIDEEDGETARRRDARHLTNETPRSESFVRAAAAVPARAARTSTSASSTAAATTRPVELDDDGAAAGARRRSRQSTPAPASSGTRRKTRSSTMNARTTRSAKRSLDEGDATASSPSASPQPGDQASRANSRAATPASTRPAKKQRTSLRVKSSPVKKKGGSAAGVPRPSGGGNAATSGVSNTTDQNDDYCSACGNVGILVCCEGCTASFHFECIDLAHGDHLPPEWYCYPCRSKAESGREHKGPFGQLLGRLDRTNPQAFKLPSRIQTYFEGVKVGADGDYEETVAAKPARRKGGYEEAPDFFKISEPDGSPVICHSCQTTAADNRAIIPCSACGFYWHLDCLDPPLAIPPVLRTWRCPAHADNLLAQLPRGLGPAHRFRTVKDAPVIRPAYSRGLKNNGFIEIESESEDDDSGWHHVNSFGRIHRLPAKGIMLDFVSQVRKQRKIDQALRHQEQQVSQPGGAKSLSDAAERVDVHPTERESQDVQEVSRSGPPPSARPIEEVQAALNLAGLQQADPSGLGQLTQALIDNASPAVVSLMARGDAASITSGNLAKADKQSLRAMLAQCEALMSRIKETLTAGSPEDDMRQDDSQSQAAQEDMVRQRSASSTPRGTHNSEKQPGTPLDSHQKRGDDLSKDTDGDCASVATESAENDLPTPATTGPDNVEMANGTADQSSQAGENTMDLD